MLYILYINYIKFINKKHVYIKYINKKHIPEIYTRDKSESGYVRDLDIHRP